MAKFEDTVLKAGTPATVTKACGTPADILKDTISVTYLYPSTRPGINVKVRFSTYGDDANQLTTVETTDVKDGNGKYPDGWIFWSAAYSGGGVTSRQVPLIRKQLPCLQ